MEPETTKTVERVGNFSLMKVYKLLHTHFDGWKARAALLTTSRVIGAELAHEVNSRYSPFGAVYVSLGSPDSYNIEIPMQGIISVVFDETLADSEAAIRIHDVKLALTGITPLWC
ncbi:MAG: hypothetical protein NVS3B25_09620 [Hymenobacter sp.]